MWPKAGEWGHMATNFFFFNKEKRPEEIEREKLMKAARKTKRAE